MARQTSCRFCAFDIENSWPYRNGEWRDRGNDTKCYTGPNAGKPHAPMPDPRDRRQRPHPNSLKNLRYVNAKNRDARAFDRGVIIGQRLYRRGY